VTRLNAYDLAYRAVQVYHASQRITELAEAIDRVGALDPLAVIVEIGCDAGGTLYCWRHLVERVYGVSLTANTTDLGGQGYPLIFHGAVVLDADSHLPSSHAWLVDELAGAPIDALIIDGDHTYAGVARDYGDYGPLVRPGGLILIHDVLNDLDPRVAVGDWWRDSFGGYPVIGVKRRGATRPLGFGVITV
jgi:hypothetical protein